MNSAFEKIHQHLVRLTDEANEANSSLWNALLTGNGLMLAAAAFVASPTGPDRVCLTALLVSAGIVAVCLIGNFRSTQKYLFERGRMYSDQVVAFLKDESIDLDFEREIDSVAWGEKCIRCRENTAITLMTFELILLAAMIWTP